MHSITSLPKPSPSISEIRVPNSDFPGVSNLALVKQAEQHNQLILFDLNNKTIG